MNQLANMSVKNSNWRGQTAARLEKEIEDHFWDKPSLMAPLLYPWSMRCWVGRQSVLPSGRADLIGIASLNGVPRLVLVEFKRGEVKRGDINQICGYAADLDAALEQIYWDCDYTSPVIKLLIGEGASEYTIRLAHDLGVSVALYKPDQNPTKYKFSARSKLIYQGKIDKLCSSNMFNEFRYHARSLGDDYWEDDYL
jgi:hypothetical protein